MVTIVEIPMPTPSLNKLRKMHFHAVKRLRDQYTVLLRAATNAFNRAGPHQFRQVTIERHGARLLDYDNLVGGCKPLIDALCRSGLLWDDSPRHCQVTYTQTKTSAALTKTVVRIV